MLKSKEFKFWIVFVLIFAWIYSGWPQIWQDLSFPPEIQKAQAATALTTYFTNTNDTLVITARQLTNSAPASETSVTTKIGKSTNWGEVDSQGTTVAWPAAASEPAASGNGLIWDVTTLEGQQILAGNWTPSVKLKVSVGSIVADIHVRGFVRSSGGAFTQIFDTTNAAQTINTTAATYAFTATSTSVATNFNTGDKFYVDILLKITTNSTGSNTATVSLFENGGSAEAVVTPGYQPQPVTTLGDGTNPPNATIGPGAVATSSDAFTFQTNLGTESIINVTTTLAGTGNYAGIGKVEIVDQASTTVYGSVTNPSTNAFSISLSGLTVSTTQQNYQIRITPLSATAMPSPPGALYVVTSTITAWTGASGNTQAGTDSGSATITIDNLSPSDVTNATSSSGNTQVTLNWTNPTKSNYATTTVFRATSTIGSLRPTEGTTYATGTAITATTTVACVVVGAAGGSVGCTDTGLTNGTTYYYRIFAADVYANYSTPGVEVSSTPNVASTISCSTNVTSSSFGALTTASIFTSTPNASTTMTCSGTALGCTLSIKDAGNNINGGLSTSSPAYLIPSPNAAFSATAVLAAGTEGYGIQAATTTAGTGGVLSLNSSYLQTGNTVGGLTTSTLTLASSTVDVSGREVVVTHKAAISATTQSGSYVDTITYACVAN